MASQGAVVAWGAAAAASLAGMLRRRGARPHRPAQAAMVPLLGCCGAGEAAGRAGASPREVQAGCGGCLRGCCDAEAAARAWCGEWQRVPPYREMYRSEIGDEKITETLH